MPLFWPLTLVWIVIFVGQSRRQASRYAAGSAVITMAVLAPWTLRNYLELGGFVPVKSVSGFTLWVGNNPLATGTTFVDLRVGPTLAEPPRETRRVNELMGMGWLERAVLMEATLPPETQRRLAALSELERDHAYRDMALTFIREHPARAATLTARKYWYFWWVPPTNLMPTVGQSRYGLLRSAAYAPALLLGLVGLVLTARGRRPLGVLIALLFVSISSVYAVTLTGLARYRTPLEPLLVLLGSFAIMFIYDWARLTRIEERHQAATATPAWVAR
jgi:hypothetical protein